MKKSILATLSLFTTLSFAQQPVRATQAATDSAWLFADDPSFTAGTNGDDCLAISNALASPLNLSGQIDACGFTGPRACNSNPFAGYNGTVTLKLCGQFITSQPWAPPRYHHIVYGVNGASGAAGGATFGGAGIYACSANTIPGGGWDGMECKVTSSSGTGIIVPKFPGSGAPPLTFHYPHYKFPAGTYNCVYCEGALDTLAGGFGHGWESEGVGFELHNLVIDAGNIDNTFAFYSENGDIRNDYSGNQFEALGCGNGSAGMFFDASEGPTTSAGPARFTIGQNNVQALTSADCLTAYGFVFEGSRTAVVFSGSCTTMPVAHVTNVVGGNATTYKIDNGGVCSGTPIATVYGAPPTYNGTLAIATPTVHLTGGVVTSIDATTGTHTFKGLNASGPYGLGPVSVTNSSHYIETAAAVDGTLNPIINVVHAEWTKMYAVEFGDTQLTAGGQINGVDNATSGGFGDALHIGTGSDGNLTATAIAVGGNSRMIQDEINLLTPYTANLTTCPNSSGVVSYYKPGSAIDCGSGLTALRMPTIFTNSLALVYQQRRINDIATANTAVTIFNFPNLPAPGNYTFGCALDYYSVTAATALQLAVTNSGTTTFLGATASINTQNGATSNAPNIWPISTSGTMTSLTQPNTVGTGSGNVIPATIAGTIEIGGTGTSNLSFQFQSNSGNTVRIQRGSYCWVEPTVN